MENRKETLAVSRQLLAEARDSFELDTTLRGFRGVFVF
jgi:hypothetical protein